jgi:hypothetical protein
LNYAAKKGWDVTLDINEGGGEIEGQGYTNVVNDNLYDAGSFRNDSVHRDWDSAHDVYDEGVNIVAESRGWMYDCGNQGVYVDDEKVSYMNTVASREWDSLHAVFTEGEEEEEEEEGNIGENYGNYSFYKEP